MKVYGKIKRKLDAVLENIDNSILRESARGVPHIVIDSKYSVCYFLKRDVYKVFKNYASPENEKVKTVKEVSEVIELIDQLRKGEL